MKATKLNITKLLKENNLELSFLAMGRSSTGYEVAKQEEGIVVSYTIEWFASKNMSDIKKHNLVVRSLKAVIPHLEEKGIAYEIKRTDNASFYLLCQ